MYVYAAILTLLSIGHAHVYATILTPLFIWTPKQTGIPCGLLYDSGRPRPAEHYPQIHITFIRDPSLLVFYVYPDLLTETVKDRKCFGLSYSRGRRDRGTVWGDSEPPIPRHSTQQIPKHSKHRKGENTWPHSWAHRRDGWASGCLGLAMVTVRLWALSPRTANTLGVPRSA